MSQWAGSFWATKLRPGQFFVYRNVLYTCIWNLPARSPATRTVGALNLVTSALVKLTFWPGDRVAALWTGKRLNCHACRR